MNIILLTNIPQGVQGERSPPGRARRAERAARATPAILLFMGEKTRNDHPYISK